MSLPRSVPACLAFVIAASCGGTSPAAPAADNTAAVTVTYTAVSSEFLSHSEASPNLLIVLTLENNTRAAVTRRYLAGCPIRMRLYRPLDNQLMYDETLLACSVMDSASRRIEAGAEWAIGSGYRQMIQMAGDSLPYGRYRLVAVPTTEGARVLEVEAGEAFIRPYPSWPAAFPGSQ